jgi:lipopolysaccharide/colanic/teichoic acid biosynthesis glycosyltransferase
MSAIQFSRFERLAYGQIDAARAPISYHAAGGAVGCGGRPMPPRDVFVKRAEDIVLASLGILLLAIPMLLAAVMIRLTSPGPAIFAQERIGLNGRRFVMLKFRTMRHTSDNGGTCPQAIRDDPRVTWIGRLLRRSSFDELPQLLNVLAGSMSLVGPRPHAPGTCVAGRPFEAIIYGYAARHSVKPGMTGLAQVRGWRGETDTEEKLIHRIESDLEYIANWSLSGDLLIVCRTIVTVMRMRNAY